ncbi:MAG: hypothetical protein C0591_03185 [Marinilabiliales bacterium]|nr:MAG: hypothetical protein C0591_03185 [Marinilabiliales bacterium]
MSEPVSHDGFKASIRENKEVRAAFKALWQRSGPKCGGTWQCSQGGFVQHCGHPTANYPYIGSNARGETILAENGRGFRLLIDAQVAVIRSNHWGC